MKPRNLLAGKGLKIIPARVPGPLERIPLHHASRSPEARGVGVEGTEVRLSELVGRGKLISIKKNLPISEKVGVVLDCDGVFQK